LDYFAPKIGIIPPLHLKNFGMRDNAGITHPCRHIRFTICHVTYCVRPIACALVANDIKKKKERKNTKVEEREKQNAIDILPTPVRQKITLVIVLVVSNSAESKIVMS